MYTPNRLAKKAIIQELRYQMRYANSEAERTAIQSRIDFWLNFNPNQ